MTRIIDKINARRKKRYQRDSFDKIEEKPSTQTDSKNENLPSGWYYSFEFFPPKTEPGLDNLLTRIERMTRRLDPLFIDVTWGSAGSTSARTLSVASHAQRFCGVDVLMHLTTTGMTRDKLASVLQQAKSCGIHNILALRGDPPRGKRSWEPGDVSGSHCGRATDLVKLIRELHGDYFGIAVAGHPEGHPSSGSMKAEMQHLKEKMEAGADFIITQFFYDVQAFINFVKRCRENGITCPIMPGIMPIQSHSTFVRMTQYCGVAVPQSIMDRLEPVKNDDEAVKEIGCEISADMCSQILSDSECDVDGVHFYTLNLERSVTKILLSMGAIDLIRPENIASEISAESKGPELGKPPSAEISDIVLANSDRPFPWRPSAMAQRSKEEVR
jgi:methylenetetrahydrofolate reductase (NADPH)